MKGKTFVVKYSKEQWNNKEDSLKGKSNLLTSSLLEYYNWHDKTIADQCCQTNKLSQKCYVKEEHYQHYNTSCGYNWIVWSLCIWINFLKLTADHLVFTNSIKNSSLTLYSIYLTNLILFTSKLSKTVGSIPTSVPISIIYA